MSDAATQAHTFGFTSDVDQFLTFTIQDEEPGIMDAYSDVLNISKDQFEATASVGGDSNSNFFSRMSKLGDKSILLLDIDQLVRDTSFEVSRDSKLSVA